MTACSLCRKPLPCACGPVFAILGVRKMKVKGRITTRRAKALAAELTAKAEELDAL